MPVRPSSWRRKSESSRRGSATPLRSGWAWGQQYLNQAVAVADAPVGKGRLVMFGPEVLWRAQPHATFKLFFNAIYDSAAMAGGASVRTTEQR